MFYVYLLRIEAFPDETYVGFTADLKARFRKHNEGASIHTAKYKPWRMVAYFAFADEGGRVSSNIISSRDRAKRSPSGDSGDSHSLQF